MENHLDGYLFDPSKYNDPRLMAAEGCTCRQCEHRICVCDRNFCKAHKSKLTSCGLLRVRLNHPACYRFIKKIQFFFTRRTLKIYDYGLFLSFIWERFEKRRLYKSFVLEEKRMFFLIPAIMISKDPCRCSISLLFLSFELEFYIQWDLPF